MFQTILTEIKKNKIIIFIYTYIYIFFFIYLFICLNFNLSHQGVLSDKANQEIQWKTGHHFQAVAVGKLMA